MAKNEFKFLLEMRKTIGEILSMWPELDANWRLSQIENQTPYFLA